MDESDLKEKTGPCVSSLTLCLAHGWARNGGSEVSTASELQGETALPTSPPRGAAERVPAALWKARPGCPVCGEVGHPLVAEGTQNHPQEDRRIDTVIHSLLLPPTGVQEPLFVSLDVPCRE